MHACMHGALTSGIQYNYAWGNYIIIILYYTPTHSMHVLQLGGALYHDQYQISLYIYIYNIASITGDRAIAPPIIYIYSYMHARRSDT